MNRLGSAGALFRIESQRVLPSCSTRLRPYRQLLSTAQNARKPSLAKAFNALGGSRAQLRFASYEQKAKALNQEGVDQQLNDYDAGIAEEKEKQKRAPWHREGSDEPPVRRQRSAGAMTKGKLEQSWSRFRTDNPRETPHYPFTSFEACVAAQHSRYQHRQERCRSFGASRAPQPTAFLSHPSPTVGATLYQDREGRQPTT